MNHETLSRLPCFVASNSESCGLYFTTCISEKECCVTQGQQVPTRERPRVFDTQELCHVVYDTHETLGDSHSIDGRDAQVKGLFLEQGCQ